MWTFKIDYAIFRQRSTHTRIVASNVLTIVDCFLQSFLTLVVAVSISHDVTTLCQLRR